MLNIPFEEAIFYIEELLRDSVSLLGCVSATAPLYSDWCRKVLNMLAIIYGESSREISEFRGIRQKSNVISFHMVVGQEVAMLRRLAVDLKSRFTKNIFSRECFVAMWFDKSMESIYQEGIYSPLKHLGYNPIRVDKVEHNDRIDQKIFELIRKSRFVVADFTGQRLGVYYESGFAFGLGLPVIHTCKKDSFDERHFDVLTVNTIVYDVVEELAERLAERVQKTISS